MKFRKRRRGWSNLSPRARGGMGVLAAIQLALFVFALIDLARRPSDRVRGRKLAWLPVLFVNIVGPIAYLALGRRREAVRRR